MTPETMRGKAIMSAWKTPHDTAAYIVHEVNNSLQILMGLSMLKRQDDSDHDKAVDIALYAADRIKMVVLDLFPEYVPKNVVAPLPELVPSGKSAENATINDNLKGMVQSLDNIKNLTQGVRNEFK